MTAMNERPIVPVKVPPTESAMPPSVRPPAPIRVDRVQLERALTPVVAAIERLDVTMRDAFLPALAALGERMERMATATELAELRATRHARPPR